MKRYDALMKKWEKDAMVEMDRFMQATDKAEELDAITACAQILDMLKVRGCANAVKNVLEYGASKYGMVVKEDMRA